MLAEWEKALEAAGSAQLQLASLDPAHILKSSIFSRGNMEASPKFLGVVEITSSTLEPLYWKSH